MTPLPLLSLEDYVDRLQLIFPRAAFDTVMSSPLAGSAVAALIYVGAIGDDTGPVPDECWARPSTVLRMSDEIFTRQDEADRAAITTALAAGTRAIGELHRGWGVEYHPWYADNTRETLRDETFRRWQEHGALRHRAGLATSSPQPAWVLAASFAGLFAPTLEGDELETAVDAWRSEHMEPAALLRIRTAAQREQREHTVDVRLPNGDIRRLEPGAASQVLRGVIEDWAPRRLTDPVVLSISEPGDKVHLADQAVLARLGITIDPGALLPDALLVDIGATPITFWIIEAVNSDGPITEERKQRLLQWASDQRIDPANCQFVSAFLSRNDAAARRRLKDIATGTFAWYADEPGQELSWYELR